MYFFNSNYKVFTADTEEKKLEKSDIKNVTANRSHLNTHNFLFR